MSEQSAFWCVWNPAGSSPTERHSSMNSAMAEAQRLARKVRGQRFYVLRAEMFYEVSDLRHVVLHIDDDGVPF